jgi:hypothetical protein
MLGDRVIFEESPSKNPAIVFRPRDFWSLVVQKSRDIERPREYCRVILRKSRDYLNTLYVISMALSSYSKRELFHYLQKVHFSSSLFALIWRWQRGCDKTTTTTSWPYDRTTITTTKQRREHTSTTMRRRDVYLTTPHDTTRHDTTQFMIHHSRHDDETRWQMTARYTTMRRFATPRHMTRPLDEPTTRREQDDVRMWGCEDARMHWCNDATMQPCNHAIMQLCNDATIQRYNDRMIQRYNDTMKRWNDGTMKQWNNQSMIRWYDDTMMQWYDDTMIRWCDDAMIWWCNDTMIRWYDDTMIQWYNDTMIQWYDDTTIKRRYNKKMRQYDNATTQNTLISRIQRHDTPLCIWWYNNQTIALHTSLVALP